MFERQKKTPFVERLNAKFRLHYNDTESTEMELAEVTEIGPDGEHQFSLIFIAPQDAPPYQGLYKVEHDEIGALPLLLVPIRKNSKGLYYQAIFNNPRLND
jgi:hypothetical protein